MKRREEKGHQWSVALTTLIVSGSFMASTYMGSSCWQTAMRVVSQKIYIGCWLFTAVKIIQH